MCVRNNLPAVSKTKKTVSDFTKTNAEVVPLLLLFFSYQCYCVIFLWLQGFFSQNLGEGEKKRKPLRGQNRVDSRHVIFPKKGITNERKNG